MKENLEAKRARYAALRPPPPIPTPQPYPLIYHILNLKLSKDRLRWRAPIHASRIRFPDPLILTHIATLQQCGAPFAYVSHLLFLSVVPPGAKTLDDLPPPILQIYTRPFIFHDQQAASAEIKHQLQTQL